MTDALHVDHCHATGQVRGLLCDRCNLTLGQWEHNAGHLQRATDYVRRGGYQS
jgi:hypothetical protein